jgi:hypothetical protein
MTVSKFACSRFAALEHGRKSEELDGQSWFDKSKDADGHPINTWGQRMNL